MKKLDINKLEEIKNEIDSKKQFSRIDDIKTYETDTSNITPGSLVLEGGAFRGLYTAGVLDCLLDNDIHIANVAGISAGGLNGVNYVSGSRGRSAKGILLNRFNPRYVGPEAVIESGSIVGFKVMFEDFDEVLPLNEDKLFDERRKLYVGCTNVDTGEIEYFDQSIGHDEFYNALRATASMPFVSRIVTVKGKQYLDGGCNSKFPLDFALKMKFEKPIVVSTRPLSYRRREKSPEKALDKIFYRKYPLFVESLSKTNVKYNKDCQRIKELENEGKVFVIEPSKPVTISRLEKDIEKLGELYELGYKDAQDKLADLKTYLYEENVYKKDNIFTKFKKTLFSFKNKLFKKE